MAAVERKPVSELGDVGREFYAAMSETTYHTLTDILYASGRKSPGGAVYSSIMRSLCFHGQAEVREFPTRGRPSLRYRRVGEMYYNKLEDKRFNYVGWDELDAASKQQARDRYEGQQEWLGMEDWLYPMTTPRRTVRLARADRVLRLTDAEAEAKRQAWRAGALAFTL